MSNIDFPQRTVASPQDSADDHDACLEAVERIFVNFCQQARDAGCSNVAIGAAAIKLAARHLRIALDVP